jgi:hypothetical protein
MIARRVAWTVPGAYVADVAFILRALILRLSSTAAEE